MFSPQTSPRRPRHAIAALAAWLIPPLLASLVPSARLDAAGATWTNVIVIVADDLGWHDLGIEGASDLLTPNIDALASTGVRFTNGYATAPVCSPGRAGLLTGRYQQRFGHETNPGASLEEDSHFGLPLTERTIGDRMRALGYATGWIGKSHLGGAAVYHPNERGFDEFFGFIESHHHYVDPSVPGNPANPADYPLNQNDPIQRNGAEVNETEYLTYAFAREIEDFIDAHVSEPFFIYAPFSAVHFPLESTPELQARFAHLPGNTQEQIMRRKMAEVLGGLDDAVGRIMAKLDDAGLLGNTLIVFTSDNGGDISSENGAINLPLRGGKTEVYEGGLRVPFIMNWPGNLTPGQVVDAPVSALDILPTAIAAAGGTVLSSWKLDGVNLLPFLLGQTAAEPHETLFWRVETNGEILGADVIDGVRAVRQGNWKLVKNGILGAWELYDLATDPEELNNLASQFPDVVAQLVAAYDAWSAGLARPRWAVDDLEFATPEFILDDVRIGSTSIAYLDPDFLPGGAQLAFLDDANTLWRGDLDPATGFFVSGHGADQAIDTDLTPLASAVTGPAWGISSNGPALFYTKPDNVSRDQIWRATPGGVVSVAQLTSDNANDSFGARVSQAPSAASVRMAFNVGSTASFTASWADESTPGNVSTIPAHAGGPTNGRWLPDGVDLAFAGHPSGNPAASEVARFETATATSVFISDDDDGTEKTDVWAFHAPEIAGELAYAAVIDHSAIAIYRDLHESPGDPFARVATLTLPAGSPPRYLYSMKPLQGLRGFNGVSYFSCVAYANNDPQNPGATEMWLLGLGPDADHRLARRVDAGTAADGGDPETVVGTREVFFYYTRDDGVDQAQLHLADTGLALPDHTGDPSGFGKLKFIWDFVAGGNDPAEQLMAGTETTHLVVHNGELFAGQGSLGSPLLPPNAGFTGAQILRRDAPGGLWNVDAALPFHYRVEAMAEIVFTTHGPIPNNPAVPLLVASFSDVVAQGNQLVGVRARVADGVWEHSSIPNATDSVPTSLGSHIDASGVVPVHHIYAGLSSGEIHRGVHDPSATGDLDWTTTPPQTPNPELSATGPVMAFAEANGFLYAACGLRQNAAGGPVTGGLYVRDDDTDAWILVYRWPGPAPLHSAVVEDRVMRGLTTVPDPRGTAHDVLLAARSWPGVIERIDPVEGHKVTIELDVRDFFARRWNDDSARTAPIVIGYNGFTPVTDPSTGETVHLINLWIEHPGNAAPPHNGSHFLIRHLDGTYEAADISNFSPVLPAGDALRATRAIAASPFAEDAGNAFYFGGYDVGSDTVEETAWIMRGEWDAWPKLTISRANPPYVQLSWPVTSNDWILETSPTLGNDAVWQTITDVPTITDGIACLSVMPTEPNAFFRLRRP